MYDLQAIALRIKQQAKTQKISMKDMLPACGLGINAVSQMAQGQNMSSTNLARIADYLGCSVDYLLGRTDDPLAHKRRPDKTEFAHEGEMVIPPVKGE